MNNEKENKRILILAVIALIVILVVAVYFHVQTENLKSEMRQLRQGSMPNQPLYRLEAVETRKPDTYAEALSCIQDFKQKIENQGLHKLFYEDNKLIVDEKRIQDLIRLSISGLISVVNRESNNGRGCVDFLFCQSNDDKTVIEVKLASAPKARIVSDLTTQMEIYKNANGTTKHVSVILFFNQRQKQKVDAILSDLNLSDNPNVVLIDGRLDNKLSASHPNAVS